MRDEFPGFDDPAGRLHEELTCSTCGGDSETCTCYEPNQKRFTDALGQDPLPAKKPEHAKVSMPCFGDQHQACTGECWGGDCECDCHEPLQKLLADGFRMQERLRATRDTAAIRASNANFKLYMDAVKGHV